MSILVRASAVDGRGSVDQCSDAPGRRQDDVARVSSPTTAEGFLGRSLQQE